MESLRWLSEEYHDLNGSSFDTLDEPPSALEFSRIVHVSRPVLIKAFRTPASERWTNEYLIDKMGSSQISISVTPNGRADAIAPGLDGKLYFAEPYVQQMSMSSLLSKLSENPDELKGQTETYYLQSQNGNIYTSQFYEDGDAPSEYQPLRIDVPSQVSWCTEALDRNPDAVNIWIGDGGSVSSIHSDPYENIYTVVRGVKHFTLLPPTEGWCLEERMYPHATYTRSESGALILQPSSLETPQVRWASIADPHLPGNLPRDAHPIHVTVKSGDTLYLPAGWWHHVRQSGITIALNWWYDIEMRGMNWVLLSFLRSIKQVPSGNKGHIERDDETYD
ncbi:jmjc domain-containing protein 7 [Moniliophthora roreri MCA 2997]|uniref:Jmjc domain-containing protein 7 n=1 Tax=Moniliophthora roreri (strain MCA 2997) TaxID=1381753 RepID=V2X9Y7_MONRO|nr:jmjc domain-containing protein 7 [Moniliophthora roreri MCA 2997]